ncbi:MAG: hemolysin family protein [Clostridium sp.]|nr:hemolysin family protein [Clostridium sp.]
MSILSAITLQIPQTFGLGQTIALVCAVAALFISAFVSGSEISFFSLTPTQTEDLDQSPRGEKILRLLRNPERLLATILIANNLVNVTIVILLNYALGPVFEGMDTVLSFILQTVLLTFLILLFGEILPKLYANSYNLKWALFAAPALSFMVAVLRPLSAMLVSSSVIVNKVVKRKTDNLTTSELSQALDITEVTTPDDKQMLEGILKFGDTTAGEIMTPRVDITDLDYSASFDEVLRTVIESGYSRLPVCDKSQDDIKGILYSRDLLPYIGREDTASVDWHRLLREPYYVPESRMIDDLLEDFRGRHIHLAVVIDEFGGTQGIVTLEDVLEEIVGDINDEYDEEEKTYRRLPDDTYIFEGKTLLGDFFRITGLDEAEYSDVAEDCETLAGMLLAIKGDFPKEKEPLVYGRCRFLILEIHQHRIARVRVKVMAEQQTA